MFLKKFGRKLFRGTDTEPHASAEECIIAKRLRELMEVTRPALIDTSPAGEGTGERTIIATIVSKIVPKKS